MIHPASSDISDAVRPNTSLSSSVNFSSIRRWFFNLSRFWSAAHLSYRGGKYSVERLLALDEYTRENSLFHAIAVCVASLLPVEIFIISQEAVPLQDPALGWRANYGFWVRAAIVIGAVLYTVIVQARYFLKGFVISRRQLIVLLTCVVTVQMIIAVTFAANVWFPIPFTVITLVPAFHVVSCTFICIVAGRTVIRAVLKDTDRLVRFGSFVAAQQLLALIYPAYQVLYHATSNTKYELPVILLLPIVKLVVKNIALRCVTHLEDMMPEAVIFTVDFFNALYMATNMENATSSSTVVIIVFIDIAQFGTVLFRLHQGTATILSRLNQTTSPFGGVASLLSGTSQLCRSADGFGRQNRHRIRVRSCLHHNISTEVRELLNRLERTSRVSSLQVNRRSSAPTEPVDFNNNTVLAKRCKMSKGTRWAHRYYQNIIFPARTNNIPPGEPNKQEYSVQTRRNATPNPRMLREALEVLFTAECLLLSAYLDAVVQLFYGMFMFIMVHLQSAKYHSELVGVTTETIGDVVDSIFVFAIVELVAFGLLIVLIHRNLGINAVYHLAFVLETQTELIQSKLLTWVTMTLAFRVVHFGIDFTFKFAWLAK